MSANYTFSSEKALIEAAIAISNYIKNSGKIPGSQYLYNDFSDVLEDHLDYAILKYTCGKVLPAFHTAVERIRHWRVYSFVQDSGPPTLNLLFIDFSISFRCKINLIGDDAFTLEIEQESIGNSSTAQ